jgi:hypothetical protein
MRAAPAFGFRQAHHDVLGGDPHVARDCELEAAGDGSAVERGDRRLIGLQHDLVKEAVHTSS